MSMVKSGWKALPHDPAKEALREAFAAYQAAVLAEQAARAALLPTGGDTHRRLVEALGAKAAARTALDAAILARGGADK